MYRLTFKFIARLLVLHLNVVVVVQDAVSVPWSTLVAGDSVFKFRIASEVLFPMYFMSRSRMDRHHPRRRQWHLLAPVQPTLD